MRLPLAILLVLAWAGAWAGALAGASDRERQRSDGAIIVTNRGDQSLPGIGEALQNQLTRSGLTPEDVRAVELSGDLAADSATLVRETREAPAVFAVGVYAAETAGSAATRSRIVGVGVANPAKLRVACTYVSLYPGYDVIFDYLRGPLQARSVGVLYSMAQNREVAEGLFRASETRGVNVVPIGVSSSADLVRKLPAALARVDVLLLTVDPLVFDRRNLDFIAAESRRLKKPTLGFLDQLSGAGVTVNLVARPAAIALVAVSAARDEPAVGRRRLSVDDVTIVVSRDSARHLGIDAGRLGAHELR